VLDAREEKPRVARATRKTESAPSKAEASTKKSSRASGSKK
jgi:hypothetical protein